MMNRLFSGGRALDEWLFNTLRLDRVTAAARSILPQRFRKLSVRYLPLIALLSAVSLYAGLLPSGLPSLGSTAEREDPSDASPSQETPEAIASAIASQTATNPTQAAKAAAEVAKQVPRLATQNICGKAGVIETGPFQFPYAPQCVPQFTGDNGGPAGRGVTRDRINIAVYISTDPVTVNTTRLVGGCGSPECAEDYYRVYIDWFNKYYERYGRLVQITRFKRGSGSEANVEYAKNDALDIVDDDPKVFAVLGGPRQAGSVFAHTLAAAGVMCFCTAQVPEDIYTNNDPYVWATLPSSSQAYIHRAEYIGKRLAGRKATRAGDEVTRSKDRSFALVWFNNYDNDYASGIEFFEKELDKYGVKLKTKVEYKNVEGCQLDAGNMILQLMRAEVTTVIMATDPVCPISLTEAADKQLTQWEWLVTGSYLTDSNFLARLYNQNQWAHAFGISLLYPEVKDQNELWWTMYKEAQGNRSDPRTETALFWTDAAALFTGIHLAGHRLTVQSFKVAMATFRLSGGSQTLPRWSYGPKKVGTSAWFDHCGWDDAAELWWDRDAIDPNGHKGAYRWPNEGRRYEWGAWPSTEVTFTEGTVGYEDPPDY